MKLPIMIQGSFVTLKLLNPHGSDETSWLPKGTSIKKIFLTHTVQMKLKFGYNKYLIVPLLNPHGSDETFLPFYGLDVINNFLTHTVQMKQFYYFHLCS